MAAPIPRRGQRRQDLLEALALLVERRMLRVVGGGEMV
jgi:hypothetical protein